MFGKDKKSAKCSSYCDKIMWEMCAKEISAFLNLETPLAVHTSFLVVDKIAFSFSMPS
jgi:hypothetical protein